MHAKGPLDTLYPQHSLHAYNAKYSRPAMHAKGLLDTLHPQHSLHAYNAKYSRPAMHAKDPLNHCTLYTYGVPILVTVVIPSSISSQYIQVATAAYYFERFF